MTSFTVHRLFLYFDHAVVALLNSCECSDGLVAQTYPVRPSTESSIGSMCTRLPYLTDGHGAMDTTSDRRTRRLFRTTRFMRIFSSGQLSSESTMQTVSLRRLPFRSTVSPRNSWSCSIFACTRECIVEINARNLDSFSYFVCQSIFTNVKLQSYVCFRCLLTYVFNDIFLHFALSSFYSIT